MITIRTSPWPRSGRCGPRSAGTGRPCLNTYWHCTVLCLSSLQRFKRALTAPRVLCRSRTRNKQKTKGPAEQPPHRVRGRPLDGLRRGTNGVSTDGVSSAEAQRDFLGTPVNLLLSSQKCPGVPFSPICPNLLLLQRPH